MKKIIYALILVLITMSFSGCKSVQTKDFYAEGNKLNTYVSVRIYEGGSQKIADDALALCDRYELIFSRTDEKSLLYKLNNEGRLVIDSEEAVILADLINTGLEYCRLTQGALDISIEPVSSLWDFEEHIIPKDDEIETGLAKLGYGRVEVTDKEIRLNGARIDLGAVAKGYIADRMRDYLLENGVKSALINLGGNILCVGSKPDGAAFAVGIKNPFGTSSDVILGLNVKNMSVVTSGVYERYFYDNEIFYHHILNPATGYPCDNGLLSVTVIAEDSTVCDCLSTGLFVLGKDKAIELVNNMESVYAIIIDENYEITYSEGAKAFVR